MDLFDDINDIFEEIISDEEEDFIDLIEEPRRNRIFHDRRNHIAVWSDREFVQRFRISKQSVEMVLQRIHGLLERRTERNFALSPQTQLLVTLRFYASGSMLIAAADFGGIHESSTSVAIKNVSAAIASLREHFIQLPHTREELVVCKNEFHDLAGFPTVIGAIDCTHVKIQSPGGENGELFRNRKGWFSLNVQTVSDANLKITDIVARWPGSAHDKTIFANSTLKALFERGQFPNCFLVGDSGYNLSNYLMTPVLNPQTRAQQLYNESQIRTRNVVERQYGIWKRRFQVLRLEMRLKLETVMAIIVSTAILHNIAIINHDHVPEEIIENEIDQNVEEGIVANVNDGGEVTRQNLIDTYFENL